jgi:hypothetical protein
MLDQTGNKDDVRSTNYVNDDYGDHYPDDEEDLDDESENPSPSQVSDKTDEHSSYSKATAPQIGGYNRIWFGLSESREGFCVQIGKNLLNALKR